MQASLQNPVQYSLVLDQQAYSLNNAIGKKITIIYDGKIHCIHCGRATKKSYSQGFCFPCMRSLAQCDVCIMKPELCHYDNGDCREPEWGEKYCMQPHTVYLSNTSDIKVGITRNEQIPTRWIDQGAIQALPIIEVKSRYLSGLIEVELKNYFEDKTLWRKMLQGESESIDLAAERDEVFEEASMEIEQLQERFGEEAIELLEYEDVVEINYPVEQYPKTPIALSLDKTPLVEGILKGIKGQYLILETGVINLRKFTGYEVTIHLS
ncbi:MAG: DUF2797 domain-containing protein [Thiotrichaceae bacterium]|nr:DUF2797 domain-containing protein [Thiotrichaceae bacterium]